MAKTTYLLLAVGLVGLESDAFPVRSPGREALEAAAIPCGNR
ncbi:MAG: hypothetical protein AAFP04_04465 [Myxococcota bacterium]